MVLLFPVRNFAKKNLNEKPVVFYTEINKDRVTHYTFASILDGQNGQLNLFLYIYIYLNPSL